jgi:AraC-like DNA-binding protein
MPVPLRTVAWEPAPTGPAGARAVSAYEEMPAPGRLATVVACAWSGRPGWSRPLRVLPDGCADLAWDGTALWVVAPAAGPVRVDLDRDATSSGIRLRPGVAGHVLGVAACDLAPVTPLADLWGHAAGERGELARAEDRLHAATRPGELRSALVRLVVDRLVRVGDPDPRVPAVIAHLARPGGDAHEAASRGALSPRHLRRRLREQAGLGSTDLRRVLRFQRFLRAVDVHAGAGTPGRGRQLSLASLAVASGYADQAHLTRECRRLSGSTPRSLVRARLARP